MADEELKKFDPPFKVAIRNNATGEVRLCDYEYEIEENDYMWLEGNYSCDCNRHLFFERAGGVEPHDDENYKSQCGDTKYLVMYADAPDGRRIWLDIDESGYVGPHKECFYSPPHINSPGS